MDDHSEQSIYVDEVYLSDMPRKEQEVTHRAGRKVEWRTEGESADRPGRRKDKSKMGTSEDDIDPIYASDTLNEILQEIYASGNVPRLVEMSCQRLSEYLEYNAGVDDEIGDWMDILDALIATNDLRAIELATQMLKGTGGIPWAIIRPDLAHVLKELANTPPNLELEPEEQRLLQAYGELIGALAYFSGEKEACKIFWRKLFEKKTLFYACGLSGLDHDAYMESLPTNVRLQFLHQLQMLLAKSKEEIFNEQCCEILNKPLLEVLDSIFGNITDGEGFADEANRIVNTCITMNLYSTTSKSYTAHGTCLLKILQSAVNSTNEEFTITVAQANLNNIYIWALDDTPVDCSRIPDACHCKLGEFAEASRQLLARISGLAVFNGRLSMAKLVEIYERHRRADGLEAITDVYPTGKGEVAKIFPTLFETLVKSEENGVGLEQLYILLIKISRNNHELYTKTEIDQLESRMRQNSAEVSYILDIFVHVANHNTPIIVGRGGGYHEIALESTRRVENACKVNRMLLWTGCFSGDEAEHAVAVIEKAYKNDERMRQSAIVNNICKTWKGIAEVHADPLRKRQTLVKSWTDVPETRDAANKVLSYIGTSKTCCVVQ